MLCVFPLVVCWSVGVVVFGFTANLSEPRLIYSTPPLPAASALFAIVVSSVKVTNDIKLNS